MLRDARDSGLVMGMRNIIKEAVRSLVDGVSPGLGLLYRNIRDRKWAAKPVKLKYGFLLCSPPAFLTDTREKDERKVFDNELGAADVCVDIGANVGFYACLARQRGKRVVAIEPLAQNLFFLYRNLTINNFTDVEVFPVGLAGKPGLEVIYGFSDIASFIPGWSRAADSKFEQVALSTLDILMGDRFTGQRLLIKIDVEGFEFEVLKGASRILESSPKPTWIVEVLLRNPLNGMINQHFCDVFRVFWQHGYNSYQIEGTLRLVNEETVEQWMRDKTLGRSSHNFLFRENLNG